MRAFRSPVLLSCLLPAVVAAQQPPAVARLLAVHAELLRFAAARPGALWPGFRPETIPVVYVVPDQGTLIAGWGSAPLPEGFGGVPGGGPAGSGWMPEASRGAASTNVSMGGRNAAMVFAGPEMDGALLFGTTIHEAFHVFERSVQRDDRKFGSGENSFLVSSYPVFDATNEAGWDLEGRLLGRALDARDHGARALRAREFVAAREARHRAIGAELAEFEDMAELNEGLAEYTLVRSLAVAAADPAFPWREAAARQVARHRARLDSLTADVRQSLRLRFYATGPAMGVLLDALAGEGWKARLVALDLTMEEALAEAAGFRDPERALLARAARAVDTAALGAAARVGVERLRAIRHAQVDSVLARPGVRVVLRADSLPGARLGLCGIDPQNLLQVSPGVLLHTRWVRVCGGGAAAEFTTAVVQDRAAGTFTAVVGPDDSVTVTAAGAAVAQPGTYDAVKVESPSLTFSAPRAMVRRTGSVLEVVPLPK